MKENFEENFLNSAEQVKENAEKLDEKVKEFKKTQSSVESLDKKMLGILDGLDGNQDLEEAKKTCEEFKKISVERKKILESPTFSGEAPLNNVSSNLEELKKEIDALTK